MSAIAKNNAFGAGSPSWNLSFPNGNLTAAEILAYLPHWLKSVDVILRFVHNGGRSVTITHLLDKFRFMPGRDYKANSTTIMMHYAMRRAGKEEWTIGTRHEFQDDRVYDENSLYVGDFRAPRLTHPKTASCKQQAKMSELARNWAAPPIPFTDLALHVKEHPSGNDALDLTRCVGYALENPQEEWLFPTDFGTLVEHLGGPLPVTHSHLDKQLFGRYDELYKAHGPQRAPAKYNKKPTASSKSRTKKVTRQTRDSVLTEIFSPALGKRCSDNMDNGKVGGGGTRKSSRRLQKEPVYVEKDEDATDVESFDADYSAPREKSKPLRLPSMPKEQESDFEMKGESESDDESLPVIEEADSDFGTPSAARGKRLASHKARQTILEQSPATLMEQFRAAAAIAKPAHKPFMDHNPEMMAAARAYEYRMPVYLTAPILSANRLIVDSYTLHLYAQDGCRNDDERWASALSTYRFGGPRRHAPFRELYRLTEPMAWDNSDWAENIRWAKEQHRAFGVETWTEYDYHLECITQWRYSSMWVSEDAVVAAGF